MGWRSERILFKEHDELQFEEHDGINGGMLTAYIGLLHELTRHPRDQALVPDAGRSDLLAPSLLKRHG